jgi:hypothetical protein
MRNVYNMSVETEEQVLVGQVFNIVGMELYSV